jgi:uncharacterized membrane protein YfcA
LVDWTVAGLFVMGGLAGGIAGVWLGKALADKKHALNVVFAVLVIMVGVYIVAQGLLSLATAT